MEEETEYAVRTLVGTIGLIGGCILYWVCAYKLISCLDKKKKNKLKFINVKSKKTIDNELPV